MMTRSEQKSIRKNRVIKFGICQNLTLFLTTTIGKYIPGLVLRKNKLWRLYKDGEDRLEKEFDMVKIIQGIRNLKIITKATIMDRFIRTKVKNDGNNLINIDSDGADPDESPPGDFYSDGVSEDDGTEITDQQLQEVLMEMSRTHDINNETRSR